MANSNLTKVDNLKYNAITKNFIAGWSSLVARQAHNLKVLGSNPSPATNFSQFAKKLIMNISIKHKIFIKLIIILFLFLVFTYVFYFSLINIINYWTYSEIHINYSLGFVKRGLLGSTMLYLESIGLSKNIFFASIFYLITCCNILLFLKLINKFYKKNILLYIFFALNPSLLLFSFYDLGGYARTEIFGISVCLLHAIFAQKFYNNEINYQKYLKLSFIIIYPIVLCYYYTHK